MKKKILTTSIIILGIFIVAVVLPLLFSKKRQVQPSPTPAISQEKAAQQTQDDLTTAKVIEEFHSDYPWYNKIPVETADYRIVFDFSKNSFRIRLLTQDTPAIRGTALGDLKAIGADLNFYQYYFLEPETGFENLLR